ncbi:DeoR/GlpR family DNA-binding transcription regulator [Xylanimonas ulmi]|uniref:DeoR family transcriptional regulator n=1 Tax=Xylanimonas ulmi TaxID=228973 RepID=A0A4Q7M0I1_9MICO|nr:DeoR/GlpR family DNA-binding transcription regulator [Xylanibacterium ulmi]RZS59838.1 DeoR family transcriptional regulator [Xylanibacterium ulmi]
MDRDERLSQIADAVTADGSMSVEQVIERFGVSAATARRDLDALAGQQLVTRTRGGAVANATSGDLPLRYKAAIASGAKHAIAAYAAGLVRPGAIVAFNGGTTTTLVARHLAIRSSAEDAFGVAGLTVVTNAVNIANDLIVRPRIRVMVTGGVARTRSYELVGPLAMSTLPRVHVDTLFLGVSAVDPARGLYADHEGEAEVNDALRRMAEATYVVADGSKLRATAFALICGLDDVTAVITDDGADPHDVAALRARGVEVVLAPRPGAPSRDAHR